MNNMETLACYYVTLILENKSQLVNDILDDVVEELRQSKIISNDEYTSIMGKEFVSAHDFHGNAEKLINVILSKPHSDVIKFVKILRPHYSWLYEIFNDDKTNECLLNGSVPALPKLLAKRTEMLKKVRGSLTILERGHFVVLHGMPGCGKTTLAAHSLHDAQLLRHFNYSVLWLSTHFDDIQSIHNSINIFLKNKGVQLSGNTDTDRLLLKNALEKNECLMVLDDVRSSTLVQALGFGCKILITTKDKTIMKDYDSISEFIPVDDRFTEEETLNIFCQALDFPDPSKLPYEAKSIHSLTRGFPLTISLFAGILQDQKELAQKKDSDIWKHLKYLLEKKQYSSFIGNEKINYVIENAVSELDERYKQFFEYFSLFVEDINIKDEVFCTVWNLDKVIVSNILLYFVKKSLIIRKWIGNNYVYGIHDIILTYLKSTIPPAKITELHKKLIANYTAKCPNCDLSKLPDNDNYIYFYIGYHLKAAKENEKLIDLYTNLEFVEAKLKLTGPADLITDYNKYLHNINLSQIDLNKIKELKCFVEKYGRDINTMEKQGDGAVDIVQFIIQGTQPTSYLYKAAEKLAAKRKMTSYIHFPFGPFIKGNEPSDFLHQSECATTLKTTALSDIILIGYINGSIVLYNTKCKSIINRYKGHEGPIRGLALNKDNTYFLSYSNDKVVSVWRLDGDVFNFGGDNNEPRTPSPITVQENHSPLWPSKAFVSFNHLPHNGNVLCAVYGHHHPALIASSTNNSVMVWEDNKLVWLKSLIDVQSCLFCHKDATVLAGSNKIIGLKSKDGSILFETHLPINLSIHSSVISLLMNPENSEDILVITPEVISMCSLLSSDKTYKEGLKVFPFSNQYRFYHLVDIGKYIAVAYTDSEIEILEKDSASSLGLFHNQKGEVNCICLGHDKLYAAYSDKTICVWPLDKVNSTFDPLPLNPVSIVWFDSAPHIASFSKRNSILVKRGRELVCEISDVRDVHLVKLSEDCKLVAYCHDQDNYLSRTFIESPQPSTQKFQSRPSILNICKYQDHLIIIADSVDENNVIQLLVWFDNKMTFRAKSNVKIHNAYFLKESIICVLADASIKEFKVDDPAYCRSIHPDDSKVKVHLTAPSSKNHLAIIFKNGSGDNMLSVYNPFEIEFKEDLPGQCYSMAFSPDGTYLALLFPKQECIWVWKNLKGKSKGVIKCASVKGCLAISNDGSVCIRTKETVSLLSLAYDNPSGSWSRAYMTAEEPIVTASPSEPCLFATIDSCSVLHTVTPYRQLKQDDLLN